VKRKGITLPELTVCCFIFVMLIVALMTTYLHCARTFHLLVTRQGIHSELRRINALLRRDVTLTDYRSLGVIDRVAQDVSEERDSVCMVGVDAWTDRTNFDDYLKPQWNIYVIYYGTLKQNDKIPPAGTREFGQLIRSEFSQSIPFPVPLPEVWVNGTISTPGAAPSKLLTRNLVAFEAEINQIDENLKVHLVLRSESGATTGGRLRESEMIECYIDIRPENTWPPR